MSDEELRDELVTLLLAGHETTATTLAWAFHFIHTVPGVRERLLTELPRPSEGWDPAAVAALPYLDAVVKETLRKHPTLTIVNRRVQAPLTVAGWQIPAGVNLSPCIYLTHHRADLYPEPDAFRPERFLGRRYSPYEFLPFGGGARRCIGMELALFEMKVVLAALVPRISLEPLPEPVRPVRRNVTIVPSGGARMRVCELLAGGRRGSCPGGAAPCRHAGTGAA